MNSNTGGTWNGAPWDGARWNGTDAATAQAPVPDPLRGTSTRLGPDPLRGTSTRLEV